MDQNGMKAAIGQIRTGVEQVINVSPSPDDKIYAPLVLAGIDLLGELLLDIKRIAEAAERHPVPPISSADLNREWATEVSRDVPGTKGGHPGG